MFKCFVEMKLVVVEKTIPSARSRNSGLNADKLIVRDLFQECVCVSPSEVAFFI